MVLPSTARGSPAHKLGAKLYSRARDPERAPRDFEPLDGHGAALGSRPSTVARAKAAIAAEHSHYCPHWVPPIAFWPN